MGGFFVKEVLVALRCFPLCKGGLRGIYAINNQKQIYVTLFISLLLVEPKIAVSEEQIEMDVTVFKGNKELPKVLYIVPWKRLADGNIKQKLVLHSLFEEAFDPIEPNAFQRYVEDYKYFAGTANSIENTKISTAKENQR